MWKEQANPAALLVETVKPAAQSNHLAAISADSDAGPEARLSAAMVSSDPVGASTLRHMLMQSGWVSEVQEWASPATVQLHSAQDVPDLVFLNLSGDNEADFAFSQSLVKLRPGVTIAVCSANKQGNPDFLLQAMRAGVREFLEKPYDRIDVSAVIRRVADATSQTQAPKKTRSGKLLTVLGTKGGVGTSTVAVNLAVQLARTPRKTVALLDFSRPMGDVAALLDLKPRFQLRDAMQNFKRLDATMFAGLLAKHSSGLHVLCGASRLEDWDRAEFAAVQRIVEVAQKTFDIVVMDLGAFYSAEWQSELQGSEVLLVSEADLPGLAKLQRHLDALAKLGVPSTKIRLTINRWHRHDEEALKKVEKDMRTPVFARLPNDFKLVTDATLRGLTVDRGSDSLANGFQEMARRFAGSELGGEAKKSRLTQLFSF
jgi:pilus assembly protein CpaE